MAEFQSLVASQDYPSLETAYTAGREELANLKDSITPQSAPQLLQADVQIDTSKRPKTPSSNMSKEQFLDAVEKTKEFILSGDIFQLVLSQRFERRTFADPFEIYRALRVINPSPYMVYLQVICGTSAHFARAVNRSKRHRAPKIRWLCFSVSERRHGTGIFSPPTFGAVA